MGAATVEFDHGRDEPLVLQVDIPERILGVDRDLWECYANRPPGGVEMDGEIFAGCGGWFAATAERWLNDIPIKVWATGEPDYIAVLETVLMELAPILNLEFEWAGSEEEADFKAFVGVPRSEASALGFDYDPALVHYWGFAGAAVNGGEATSGYVVIWYTEEAAFRSWIDAIRAVTIHEALHALGPIGHRIPLGHSSRPLSFMEVSKMGVLSQREKQLLEINSHPLVRPGLTMDAVRRLVVLTEELLDYPLIESAAAPDDPLDLIWRAYVELEKAGSASFRLSGGWTDRACNHTFGVRRGPIGMAIGDFSLIGDWPELDPALVRLDFHTNQFHIVYSREDGEWLHWQLSTEAGWEKVDRNVVSDSNSYWLWNGKLLTTLRSVLWDGSAEDIGVDETSGGNLRFRVELDESYLYMWDWTPGESVDFTLVVNPETFAVVGYTWELRKDPDANPGQCLTYKEVATDGRLGVDIVVPEAIRNQ